MDEYASLNHTVWECKYHVVVYSKCRRKTCTGNCEIIWEMSSTGWPSNERAEYWKGTWMPTMFNAGAIPPKYAVVAGSGGTSKAERDSPCEGVRGGESETLWGSTSGPEGTLYPPSDRDETVIREYIKNQEKRG